MTVQVTAGSFCAGLVFWGGVVHRAAPIIKYMVLWTLDEVKHYAKLRGWKVTVVSTE